MRPWPSVGVKRGPPYLSIRRAQPFHASSLLPFLLSSLAGARILDRRPGDGAKNREKEGEREGRGTTRRVEKTRLPESRLSRLSTLHGSTRYLPGHLHIKLTHNARHISGSAARQKKTGETEVEGVPEGEERVVCAGEEEEEEEDEEEKEGEGEGEEEVDQDGPNPRMAAFLLRAARCELFL